MMLEALWNFKWDSESAKNQFFWVEITLILILFAVGWFAALVLFQIPFFTGSAGGTNIAVASSPLCFFLLGSSLILLVLSWRWTQNWCGRP